MSEQTVPLNQDALEKAPGIPPNGNKPPEPIETRKKRPSDLVTIATPNSPLVEQYKMLFTRVDRACTEQGKRMIVVTSATSGEGKTTTAANLAVVAARNFGRKCLLMDVHFKNPDVAPVFQLGRGLGLIDVMMNRRVIENVLVPSSIENLTLLPMGHFLGKKAGVLNVDGLKDVFAKIRGEYYHVLWNEDEDDFAQMEQCGIDLFDYIFVDAPIASAPEMGMISDAADALLFVVRANTVAKSAVKQAFAHLDATKIIGSVLNYAKPDEPAWAYR